VHYKGFDAGDEKVAEPTRRSNMSREQVARSTAPWHWSAGLLGDRARFERSIQNAMNNPYAQQDHAFIRQAQALIAFDAEARLGGIKAPTLVVSSQDDILIPPRNGEKLAKLIPGATYQALPGTHLGVIENAAEYNAAFAGFLKGE
jgi:pimeloyl-ACP methyl ester carboxylesterase